MTQDSVLEALLKRDSCAGVQGRGRGRGVGGRGLKDYQNKALNFINSFKSTGLEILTIHIIQIFRHRVKLLAAS